jgi:hypothetical protein
MMRARQLKITPMKLAFAIIFVFGLLAFALFYFSVDRTSPGSVAMPWHVEVHDAQHSEVFGIVLNQTDLQQARERFGQLEGMALFRNPQGIFALEAYFGKVNIGPFGARFIATLDIPQAQLEAMMADAIQRVVLEDGSMKWTLKQDKLAEQAARKIKTLSYIPSYRGMDAEFITQHFGQPERREAVGETGELLYYPKPGVRILVDSEGSELFEYLTPADFKLAYGAQ